MRLTKKDLTGASQEVTTGQAVRQAAQQQQQGIGGDLFNELPRMLDTVNQILTKLGNLKENPELKQQLQQRQGRQQGQTSQGGQSPGGPGMNSDQIYNLFIKGIQNVADNHKKEDPTATELITFLERNENVVKAQIENSMGGGGQQQQDQEEVYQATGPDREQGGGP